MKRLLKYSLLCSLILLMSCSKRNSDPCDTELSECFNDFIEEVKLGASPKAKIDLIVTKENDVALVFINDTMQWEECSLIIEDCSKDRSQNDCGDLFIKDIVRGSYTCKTLWKGK